jgi:hypothetical protein
MAYILKVRARVVSIGSSLTQKRLVVYPVHALCFANPPVAQSSRVGSLVHMMRDLVGCWLMIQSLPPPQ